MKVSVEESLFAFKYLASITNDLRSIWTSTGVHNMDKIDLRVFGKLTFVLYVEDFSFFKKLLFRVLCYYMLIPSFYKNQKYRVLCAYDEGEIMFKIICFHYNYQYFSMPIESIMHDNFMNMLKEKCDEIYKDALNESSPAEKFHNEYGVYNSYLRRFVDSLV